MNNICSNDKSSSCLMCRSNNLIDKSNKLLDKSGKSNNLLHKSNIKNEELTKKIDVTPGYEADNAYWPNN